MALPVALLRSFAGAVLLSGSLPAAAVPQTAGAGALAAGELREVRLAKAPGSRAEHFRLDRSGGPGHGPGAPGRPEGLARWLSGPDPEEPGALRIELEVLLLEEGVRIFHVERVRRDGWSVIWREVGERKGRTLHLDRKAGGTARLSEAAGGPVRRFELPLGPHAAPPLAFVELVRRGERPPGRVDLFQPLARAFEPLAVTLEPSQVPPAPDGAGSRSGERTLELRRRDGTLAGRYRLREGSLHAFTWQEGGLRASVVSAEEHRRLAAARAP